MSEKNQEPRTEKMTDVLELRRKAKEVKRYVIITRVLGLLVIILVAIIAIAYAISYFYDKYGSFTVKINKYDMMPFFDFDDRRVESDARDLNGKIEIFRTSSIIRSNKTTIHKTHKTV